MDDFTWMVGGQQGEGIESTGEIFAAALNRLGYHLHAFRQFASRVKGGHTNYRIRIADRAVRSGADQLDLLIAFDADSLDMNAGQMSQGACLVYDSELEIPDQMATRGLALLPVPMMEMAQEAGNPIMKNMAALGVSAALLGLKPENFASVLEDRFRKKGREVVERNLDVLARGYDYALGNYGELNRLPPPSGNGHLLISGNEAVAFGALAGGCRFLAAFTVTAATEIMYWLVNHLPDHGGVVVQAEDEIAAINMAIGANYAGARGMTSTSGPGLSLMMESLGLAGMTETPVVIVDVQRAGPATGLPTKYEQGNLNEMVFGSHGDLPRIVLAPATMEDAFYLAAEVFNLADRYQCAVILASDLALGMSRQSVAALDFSRVKVDRGPMVTEEELARLGDEFKRYRITNSGVSPRSVPSQKGGSYLATGDEHDEAGFITEDPEVRTNMMEKRLAKVEQADLAGGNVRYEGADSPELLLIGWGSTFGPIAEARERLETDGKQVAHLQVIRIWPFPAEEVAERMRAASRILVVENNATGQLAGLIRHQVEPAGSINQLLKFDGNPFLPREVYEGAKEVLTYDRAGGLQKGKTQLVSGLR